ncbi:TlpA family protein disulfide reductase [Bremerella cremea]|uniref:TlpA family protein disulfide reductase n=1 Tax=Bremerella cremea TaxID=1031537 RepID=A0A368KYV2_9BACT|nr:TlpA disulfide reductase family protein [Bremerella cremea]RCS54854.1 TlpA family protein disulfide reductase [Bremerella cremea]
MNRHWLAIGFVVLLAGCGGGSPAETGKPAAEVTLPATETKEVTTKVMDYSGIQMLIESYRGKVVVVDIWSTQCPPCIKELPGLVALDKAYSDEDVKCITVSLDYGGIAGETPDQYQAADGPLMKILTGLGVTCDNIIAADDSEAMLKKLDLLAPPAVLVYGRDGKLAKRFDNEGEGVTEETAFTYEDIKPLVAELVKEKS